MLHRKPGVTNSSANEGGIHHQSFHKSVPRPLHNLVALGLGSISGGIGSQIKQNHLFPKALAKECALPRQHLANNLFSVRADLYFNIRDSAQHFLRPSYGLLREQKLHYSQHFPILHKAVNIEKTGILTPDGHSSLDHVKILIHPKPAPQNPQIYLIAARKPFHPCPPKSIFNNYALAWQKIVIKIIVNKNRVG